MEPKFQKTFIPKRPVVGNQGQTQKAYKPKTSILSVLITLIFIVVLAGAGGLFGFKKYLESRILEKDMQLQENIEQLQPDVIEEMAELDRQIKLSERILSNHLVPSKFFELLEENTLQAVQFQSFEFISVPGGESEIFMVGIAPNYETVALQSDVFARDSSIRDSMFSGLSLTEEGGVSFEINAKTIESLTSYKN